MSITQPDFRNAFKYSISWSSFLILANPYHEKGIALVGAFFTSAFINDGEIPIIQRKEHIDKDQFNQDSIWTEIDTLEVVPAYDSLRGALGYSKDDMYMLAIVPSNPDSVQFELRTNMRRGEFFIQVKDPDPINPQRQEGGKLKPLRFGSLATSSTKGNWE